MQYDMKKKILIIALVCILAGVAAFYIVKVNKMYPQGSVTEYELNEPAIRPDPAKERQAFLQTFCRRKSGAVQRTVPPGKKSGYHILKPACLGSARFPSNRPL